MSAAPESARPVDSADSLDDDDATVASQPTDRPAGRLASRIRLRGTRISGLESPESDMDGRHAARRSLEPVQGARAKARASRADDLVGASVLSLSFSFLLSLSLSSRSPRLSLSLAPTKRVLLARALFTPRTFPFIEGACYRLYAASPCVLIRPVTLSLCLSLSLAPRLFSIHSLSHSLSLVRARARGSQSTLF